MIQRHADQPHDSQAETLAAHRADEAIQSLAQPALDSLIQPFIESMRTESPEALKARLWPTLAPVTLREERGLWDGPATKVAVTPREAAADFAHDERTEGYARRSFRTNIHD